MKTLRLVLCLCAAIACLSLTGCVTSRTYRLPNIAADEVEVNHTDWFGSIKASGTDMRVTEKYITWGLAKWEVTYGGWHDTVLAKNYRQRRETIEVTPAAPLPIAASTIPPLLAKP